MAREIARGPVYLHKRSSCVPGPNLIGGSHLTILVIAGNFSTRRRLASSMRMAGWLNKDFERQGGILLIKSSRLFGKMEELLLHAQNYVLLL
jgi:hypothetical protein